MSPGHIAPLLNGSLYWTVSPFMAACDALGFPDVVSHVLKTFCPRAPFCLQASIDDQPIRAPANASPALSARFSSALSKTPSGVALSASSSSSASSSFERFLQLLVCGLVHHLGAALAHRLDKCLCPVRIVLAVVKQLPDRLFTDRGTH